MPLSSNRERGQRGALPRLRQRLQRRRWAVLRCYLNAAGSARHPDPDHARIPFAPFRGPFLQAGFEVVDCPPLTPQGKNAADIRLTVDVVDALHGPTRYDEFVVVCADSDFTPLLVRLRAANRRTTLVSAYRPVGALTSVADGLEVRFARTVRRVYASADAPLSLGGLGQSLSKELGPAVKDTRWFGCGTLSKAVDGLALTNALLSQHHLWDSTRPRAPRHAG